MPTPPRLIGQIAAEASERGKRVTEHQVRQALYLSTLGAAGRSLDEAARAMRLSRRSVQRVSRRWIIDFADYRPFARCDPRPDPIARLA